MTADLLGQPPEPIDLGDCWSLCTPEAILDGASTRRHLIDLLGDGCPQHGQLRRVVSQALARRLDP